MATTSSTRSSRRHGVPHTSRLRPGARPLGWLVAAVAISLGLTLAYAPAAQADDEHTATIRGRVVDSAGEPVPGITVAAETIRNFSSWSKSEWSKGDGTFTIMVPPASERLGYWLTFRDDNLPKTYAYYAIGDEDTPHKVGDDSPWDVGDVRLDRLASISGTVAQPDGTPAKSVWVIARVAGQPATDTSIRTTANGTYTLRVAPGAAYTVRAYLSGAWESSAVIAPPLEEDQAMGGIDLVVTSVACPVLRTALATAKRAHDTAQKARAAAGKAAAAAQQKAAKTKSKVKKAKKASKPAKKVAKLKAKAKKAKSNAKAATAASGSSAAAATNAARALAKAQADVNAKCLPRD